MSLSWRKRQAKASDQKTWRGMGVDSALWKSIGRNAGNVKVALGNSGTKGVVTGLKFVKTEGLNLTSNPGDDIYVSDPSNANVGEISGVNTFDTPCPTSVTGSGLAFSMKKFGAENFNTQAVPHDISENAIKYKIINGGSGYKVGDTFTVQGANQYGKTVNIGGSTTEATALTAGAAVQQEAYKITDFSGCVPAAAAAAGVVVTLPIPGAPAATGFLHTAITGVPPLPPQTVKVISALDENFDSGTATGGLVINAQTASTTLLPGVENTRKAAVNGFITNQSDGGGQPDPDFYQTLAQFQAGQFEKVFSKYVSGVTTVIAAGGLTGAGAVGTITTTNTEFNAPNITNSPSNSAVAAGRLSVQVTSVTNTSPEPGRN